jgi:transposase
MVSPEVIAQVQSLLDGEVPLSENAVRELAQHVIQKGEEEIVFLLLQLVMQIRKLQENGINQTSPTTPSGMIPPYLKASAQTSKKTKKKKAGGQKGHPGSSRPKPENIDHHKEHRLESCPDCGGALQRCNGKNSSRTRIIEDIPADIRPEVTEHTIHRDYCPTCKKLVEPKVDAALPKSTIGHRTLALSAYWHYALGMTTSQIVETLNDHLHFPLSKGGLIGTWHQLCDILMTWYEALSIEIQNLAVLHGDETGWRVNGTTHWLWCFTDKYTTFYMIDRSRGQPALKKIFKEVFSGILVTDFWAAYNSIQGGERQCCLFHLLNELAKVDEKNTSEEWMAFSKKLQRLIHDGLRLHAREDFSREKYDSRIKRIDARLVELAFAKYSDADANRLAKRLQKYNDNLFVFLDYPDVPATNNHAEREIRVAVMIRKVIYGNRSKNGALTQSVLMTIFRTLKRRGYNPIQTLVSALQEYIRTGQLPPFPAPITSTE